ncbi:MAG: homocysteine S-methyltransferase family protein [Planctomycetota bacterium]
MKSLLERVAKGEILVSDGAWGTQLMERGIPVGSCFEAANLERPGLLAEIALLYLEAGAQLITTNTFGGSPLKLAAYGLEARTEEVNRRAVEAIRGITWGHAFVSASVGPTGAFLEPYGDTKPETMRRGFERQIRSLVESGADAICIETMTDLSEARLAVEAARSVSATIPVMATMTFDKTPRGFFTMMGVSIEQAAAGLEEAGASIIGSNCGNGIDNMIAIAREFRERSRLPLLIQSNAGLPQQRDGKVFYPESPEYMAAKARELIALGVSIIGGCCGTTPEHIRALRSVVDETRARP